MTEEEWLTATDPEHLADSLSQRRATSGRKARLFACACCRQIWEFIPLGNLREGVDVSERFADRESTAAQLRASYRRARRAQLKVREALRSLPARSAPRRFGPEDPVELGTLHAADAAQAVTFLGIGLVWLAQRFAARATQGKGDILRDQVVLLRDIFGNPFRPVAFSPSWFTPSVTALARRMYDTRDFSAMPILADALQDAGCEDTAVLEHCRGNGPHARGCSVLDMLLGKE